MTENELALLDAAMKFYRDACCINNRESGEVFDCRDRVYVPELFKAAAAVESDRTTPADVAAAEAACDAYDAARKAMHDAVSALPKLEQQRVYRRLS